MARKRTRRPESPSAKGSSSGARKSTKPARTIARRGVSTRLKLEELSARQFQEYDDSLNVVAASRRGHVFGLDSQGRFSRITVRGPRHAARIIGIPFRKVERYVSSAFFRDRKGRIQVTPADRLPRRMWLPTALGDQPIVVRGSRKASLLAAYRVAVLTGNETELQRFKGKRVAGYELITDVDTIQALLDAGAIDPVEMYAPIPAGGAV
jgi:hypothetical protein